MNLRGSTACIQYIGLAVVGIGTLAGCCNSLRGRRVHQVEACFESAASLQRDLAKGGMVVEGMSRCLIYVAWGRPWKTIPLFSTNAAVMEIFQTGGCETVPSFIPVFRSYGNGYTLHYVAKDQFVLEKFKFKYVVIQNDGLTEWAYSDSLLFLESVKNQPQ